VQEIEMQHYFDQNGRPVTLVDPDKLYNSRGQRVYQWKVALPWLLLTAVAILVPLVSYMNGWWH
jgi:hypothetical protein